MFCIGCLTSIYISSVDKINKIKIKYNKYIYLYNYYFFLYFQALTPRKSCIQSEKYKQKQKMQDALRVRACMDARSACVCVPARYQHILQRITSDNCWMSKIGTQNWIFVDQKRFYFIAKYSVIQTIRLLVIRLLTIRLLIISLLTICS